MKEHDRTTCRVNVNRDVSSVEDNCASMMKEHLFIVSEPLLDENMMDQIHYMVSHRDEREHLHTRSVCKLRHVSECSNHLTIAT